MKYSKTIIFGLLIISLSIPFVSSVQAAKTSRYVGIKEGQTYVWTTEFDAGPLEEYYEDMGVTNETILELIAIEELELYEFEEEVTEWKLNVHSISKEKETHVYGTGVPTISSSRKEHEYVTVIYTLKEYDGDAGWWRTIDSYETAELWESNEMLWALTLFSIMFGPVFSSNRGDILYPALFVPKDLDWYQLKDQWHDYYEVKYTSAQNYFSVDNVKIQDYFGYKNVGIKTEYDPAYYNLTLGNRLATFESISKYNDDGVLYYYKYTYDGDIIAKFELKEFFGHYVYMYENLWWLSLVAGAIIIGLIIILTIIIKIKRK